MSVIDDLKRLERAGSESSTATQKLIDAAKRVLFLIMDTVGVPYLGPTISLPMGYDLSTTDDEEDDEYGGVGIHAIMIKEGVLVYHAGDPLQMGRVAALRIAKDVADGLLGKIAVWLDDQAKADLKTAAELEAALPETSIA